MAGTKRRWSTVGVALVTVLALPLVPAAQSRAPGRALAIEDYYRVQTVGNPEISPDGRWIVFSVATRIEEDNGTRTEFHLVPSDALSTPRRIVHYGKDITSPSWT